MRRAADGKRHPAGGRGCGGQGGGQRPADSGRQRAQCQPPPCAGRSQGGRRHHARRHQAGVQGRGPRDTPHPLLLPLRTHAPSTSCPDLLQVGRAHPRMASANCSNDTGTGVSGRLCVCPGNLAQGWDFSWSKLQRSCYRRFFLICCCCCFITFADQEHDVHRAIGTEWPRSTAPMQLHARMPPPLPSARQTVRLCMLCLVRFRHSACAFLPSHVGHRRNFLIVPFR